MRYFEAFAGVGGFSLGIQRAIPEAKCVGFSEIDKYASSVLAYHHPNTKNYGDISTIDWSTVPDFDLLVGGSPCQDLSIAGKRAGLQGSRSGLFHDYVRAIKEKKPQYFIWENVKGALSSNEGRDFAEVLNTLAEAGYSLWWQVLNAKDFGVPQNRERIFVVGTRIGSPREILFERGDAGEDSIDPQGGQTGVFPTIRATHYKNGDNQPVIKQVVGGGQAMRVYDPSGLSVSLSSQAGGTGAKTGLYFIDLSTQEAKRTDTARAIQARYHKGFSSRKGETSGVVVPVLTPDRVEKRQNGRRMKEDGDPSFTLTSQDKHGAYDGYRIRRLTELECERLMGWPDNHTKYGRFGDEVKEISGTQRYKMCGNGVVANVVEAVVREHLC